MKSKFMLLAVVILGIAFSTVAFARSSGNEVTIVNKTGRDIEALYISPVTRNDWERYYSPYSDVFYNGDSMDIYIGNRRNVQYWDIRCEYTNGREDIWYGVDLYNSDTVILRRNGDFRVDSHHNDDHDDDYYDRRY